MKSKIRTIEKFIIFGIVAVLPLTNLFSNSIKKEIILGCESSLLTAPVWIAADKGYFKEEGVTINIKEYNSGKSALNAMLNEDNLNMVTVAQTPIMFNSFKNNSFAIIAAMVNSYKDLKVFVKKDKSIKNAAGLKGKKVGLTQGSTGQFFFDLIMTFNSLTSADVEVINFLPAELPKALNDGRVDAICTWEPYILKALNT